jgi:hypothetical protein
MVITIENTMKTLIISLMAIFGAVSAQAGTVQRGHTTVHRGDSVHTGGNYHRDDYRGYHGGHGYYANEGHRGRYWHGGYYRGHYYSGGYYPYDAPFFAGLPIPIPFPVPVPE